MFIETHIYFTPLLFVLIVVLVLLVGTDLDTPAFLLNIIQNQPVKSIKLLLLQLNILLWSIFIFTSNSIQHYLTIVTLISHQHSLDSLQQPFLPPHQNPNITLNPRKRVNQRLRTLPVQPPPTNVYHYYKRINKYNYKY